MKGTAERFLGIVNGERVTGSSGKPVEFLQRTPLGVLRSSLQASYPSCFPSSGWGHSPGLGEHWKSVLAPAPVLQGQGEVLARHR